MDSCSAVLCVILVISLILLGGECEEATTPIIVHSDTDQVTTDITTTTTSTTSTTRSTNKTKAHVDNSSVLLPPNYNKYELPVLFRTEGDQEKPEKFYVAFALFIRRVLDVDTKKEILTLDTDVALGWQDATINSHLEEMNYIDPHTNHTFRNRSLDAQFLDQIWKPDIFIDEMVASDKVSLIGKLVTLNFYPEGYPLDGNDKTPPSVFVLFARRTLKLRCEMDFHAYPADIQHCRYTVRSYSHDKNATQLIWLQSVHTSIPPVYLNDPIDPNFDISLDGTRPSVPINPKKPYDDTFIQEAFNVFREGNYSALRFKISVRRKVSYHVVQTYVPSVLLVLITWLCFILPYSMIEARIGISMTTLLTLTAMFSSIREQSPDVSYTMAIDIWMVFCIFEVFLALLLFTTIYWLRRRGDPQQQGKSDNDSVAEHGQTSPSPPSTEARLMNFTQRFGFFAFACSFLLFFCGYWFYLLFSKGYLYFQINTYFNNVGKLDSEPYQCYNNRIYRTVEYNKVTKCEELDW